ncbi:MAG: hypothetical protein NTW96_17765 [Planctomycetia bacterium]|nr:hypothetical protein [Planctomycetia bacterium]
MRRHAIGVITLLLLLGAAALHAWMAASGESAAVEAAELAFWRVAALMAVLWMAWPDLNRLPAWMLVFVPVVLLLIAVRPRWAIYLIPVLLVVALLRPRKKK